MKIELKHKFMDKVTVIGCSDVLLVSTIQIFADATVLYGCIKSDGTYLWMKDYEIEKLEKENNLGFIDIE